MSDDDYSDSENSLNSDEEDIETSKKPLFKLKPHSTVKSRSAFSGDGDDDDDAEPDDDAEESDDENDELVGGADTDLEEGEVREDEDEDDDDAEPEEEVDEEHDDDSDIEINEDGEPIEKSVSNKNVKVTKFKKTPLLMNEDDDEDDDEYDESYLHKFDNEIIKNYVNEFHPECYSHNYDEIAKLTIVTKNLDGIIIDPLHRTIPYLTKYEKARILGQRAKQIETGAKPLVRVPETIVDAYIIAELELKEKRIPFIIRRPIPGGGSEYWNLKDLEIIAF